MVGKVSRSQGAAACKCGGYPGKHTGAPATAAMRAGKMRRILNRRDFLAGVGLALMCPPTSTTAADDLKEVELVVRGMT